MKKYFLLPVMAIFVFSCKDEYNSEGNFLLEFYPRKVSYLNMAPMKQVIKEMPNLPWQFTVYEGLENDIVNQNAFLLNLFTSNCNPSVLEDPRVYLTMLDDHIPEIERQVNQDYRKAAKQRSAGPKSGQDATNLIKLEYRTTPIRNLTISALNTTLFGKPAGESLNDFFDVIEYNPPAIVSYPSNNLIYGYTSKEYPKAIDEWLSLYPYAQVGMRFAPNKPISGLPVDVRFVVRMETQEGLVLSDTTRLFTITE